MTRLDNDLISRKALLEAMQQVLNKENPNHAHIFSVITNAPTVEQDSEPVAKVMFRQDEDGLQPVAFYSNDEAPPNDKLKEKFVVLGVYLKPQEWVGLND